MAKKNGEQESLARLFVRELVRAASWGTVFLLVIVVFFMGAKQNIKEAIDFSFKQAIGEAYFLASNPEVKQDIKEAIDFISEQSIQQVKLLLSDPAFKQDIKEAIDLWHACKYKKVESTGKVGAAQ